MRSTVSERVNQEGDIKIIPPMKEPVGESSFRSQVLFAARPRRLTQITCRSIYALLPACMLVLSLFTTCLSTLQEQESLLKVI